MVGVVNELTAGLSSLYSSFIALLPGWAQVFINLFILVLLIVLYSVFVWKFYTFISRKNIFELNLNQYNTLKHSFLTKVLAVSFYFIEYLLILPVIIFVWFGFFTLFLMFLVEEAITVKTILLVSATIIASIRMTAYYRKALSQDLAKLFPFMLLAAAILNPVFFKEDLFTRIITRLTELPTFFSDIVIYLLFIFLLEAVLRFFDFLFSLFSLEEVAEEEKKD